MRAASALPVVSGVARRRLSLRRRRRKLRGGGASSLARRPLRPGAHSVSRAKLCQATGKVRASAALKRHHVRADSSMTLDDCLGNTYVIADARRCCVARSARRSRSEKSSDYSLVGFISGDQPAVVHCRRWCGRARRRCAGTGRAVRRSGVRQGLPQPRRRGDPAVPVRGRDSRDRPVAAVQRVVRNSGRRGAGRQRQQGVYQGAERTRLGHGPVRPRQHRGRVHALHVPQRLPEVARSRAGQPRTVPHPAGQHSHRRREPQAAYEPDGADRRHQLVDAVPLTPRKPRPRQQLPRRRCPG